MLILPLQGEEDRKTFNNLLNACTPATFGRGGEDVYDESYRRAGALGVDKFLTDFCPYEAGIIDIVTQILLPPITGDLKPPRSEIASPYCVCGRQHGNAGGEETLGILGNLDPADVGFADMEVLADLAAGKFRQRFVTEDPVARDPKEERRMVSRGIRAELHKLNVYSGPSGLFRPHVDTPRSEVQIGSLVVCLPVPFEGGKLAVRHQQEEVMYDWAGSSSADGTPCIQRAPFYSDCEHEVLEVISGHRVTLTYNLFLAPGTSLLSGRPTSLDRERLPLAVHLKTVLANANFMPDGGYIGIHLAHCYPHTHKNLNQFVPNMLKGVDMILYESVSLLHLPAILCTVSATNTPPHGILDSLDEMEERAAGRPSKVRNNLSTFTADEGMEYESNYGDEEQAQDAVNDVFHYDTDSEGSDVAPEVSDELLKWKERFDDGMMICWVNGAKHEEVSRAFLAVSILHWVVGYRK